jgi:hypothetical protein
LEEYNPRILIARVDSTCMEYIELNK